MIVVHDKDGLYKVVVDKRTKAPAHPPYDLENVSPAFEVRMFPNEHRLREVYGPVYEVDKRYHPPVNRVVPPVSDADIMAFENNAEVKDILMSDLKLGNIALPPSSPPTVTVDRGRVDKEIMLRAKQILKTKSRKEQEILYLKLEGFVEGCGFLMPEAMESFRNFFKELVE